MARLSALPTPGAKFYRALHGLSIGAWAVIWALAGPAHWLQSVVFVSNVSMATALLTSFAAWGSTRVEVKQDEAA